MKKHKIFLYPFEENGKVKVFLFQSGDIGKKRNKGLLFHHSNGERISSVESPELAGRVYVNGLERTMDFIIASKVMEKEEFHKLKELERAYNNR